MTQYQQDPIQLGIDHGLGKYIAAHRPYTFFNIVRREFLRVVGLGVPGFIFLWLMVWLKMDVNAIPGLLVTPVLLLFLLSACLSFCLLLCVPLLILYGFMTALSSLFVRRQPVFFLYEHGVIISVSRKRLQAIRWDDLIVRYEVGVSSGDSGKDPDQLVLTWPNDGRWSYYAGRRSFSEYDWDIRKLEQTIVPFLRPRDDIFKRQVPKRHEAALALFPDIWNTYQTQQIVRFRPLLAREDYKPGKIMKAFARMVYHAFNLDLVLTVTRWGLSYNHKHLPWNEIQSITFSQEHEGVAIKKKGQRSAWAFIRMPNAEVFMMLINHIAGGDPR